MFIDSHCHPQFPQYDSDREEVIKRALDGGVQMICVGTDLAKSKQAIELAEKYDVPILSPQSGATKSRILDADAAQSAGSIGSMWATVGSHPNDLAGQLEIADFEKLLDHPKVVAVGEVGLDYYRTPEPNKQAKQREAFQQFLELAQQTNKPLIIHSRAAFEDTLDIIRNYKLEIRNSAPAAVIHSFTYTWEQAQQFLALGLYIGLNGIITFTDQYDEVVKNTPLDRILLETDAPFLAPVPNRGKRNEPLWVTAVAQQIAKIKNLSVEEVATITTANTRKLFNLTP